MKEMHVKDDEGRTPSLAYSLLHTSCKGGRVHEAIARIGLCGRFSNDKLG